METALHTPGDAAAAGLDHFPQIIWCQMVYLVWWSFICHRDTKASGVPCPHTFMSRRSSGWSLKFEGGLEIGRPYSKLSMMSGEVTPWRSFVPPIKCFQGTIREKSCQWFLIWLGYVCDLGAKKLSRAAGFLRRSFDLLVNTAQGGLFLGCSWEFCWARKYKGSKDLNFLLVCYKMLLKSLCNKALACLSFLDLGNQHWKKKSLASRFSPVSVSFIFLHYQLSHTKTPVFNFTWKFFWPPFNPSWFLYLT